MNYKESGEILKKIKLAKKVLINCHRNPDADSIGSALAMMIILERFGKATKVICPNSVDQDLKYLKYSQKIEKIDFNKFDFSEFDLFIILDTAGVNMLTSKEELFKPGIASICIDHHRTNPGFADLNLIDGDITSTSEILYRIFQDWGVAINEDIATCLFAGIVNDTGCFRYGNVNSYTFLAAAELLKQGAQKDPVLRGLLSSYDLKGLKLVGELIKRARMDEECKFIYSLMPLKDFKIFGQGESAKDIAVDMMAQTKEALFSMVMVEKEDKLVSISLRSSGNFDVSKIALKLGGGGHSGAAGCRVVGLKFDEAINKALEVAKKQVNDNKS